MSGDGSLLGKPLGSGRAFLTDAAAAAAAAHAFGVPQQAVRDALESFAPLPHRGAVVAKAGAVRFVDDSKATNPHAALAALEGLADVAKIFKGSVRVTVAPTIEEAVESAYRLAPRGGTVVLAPACASLDMFRDYRERGDRFAAAARALAARARPSEPVRKRSHA